MEAIINKTSYVEDSLFLEMSCGKKSAQIYFCTSYVSVTCLNASHKVWRGTGKTFNDIFEAIAGYKSIEMKTMLRTAAKEYAFIN